MKLAQEPRRDGAVVGESLRSNEGEGERQPSANCQVGSSRRQPSQEKQRYCSEGFSEMVSISRRRDRVSSPPKVRFNIRLPRKDNQLGRVLGYRTTLPLLKSIFTSEAAATVIKNLQGYGPSSAALHSILEIIKVLVKELDADTDNCFLGTLPKHISRSSRAEPTIDSRCSIDPCVFMGMTPTRFRELFILDKSFQIPLERFLERSGWTDQRVAELATQDLEFLITHQFGNFLVQRLMGSYPRLFKAVYSLCQSQFTKLVVNEFSSRVMQNLVETSTEFREFSLRRFKSQKQLWLKNIAGLFVLNSCMKHSAPESYKFVEEHVFSSMSGLENSKNLKRALVSLVDSTPQSYHSKFATVLGVSQNMPYWLNDKYLTYLLIAFVRSRYEPAWNGLLKLIRESLPKLLKTRYFKLLINKFISLEIIDIIQTLHQTLVRVRKEDVQDRKSVV